jgi:flagellar assembly protein FliH
MGRAECPGWEPWRPEPLAASAADKAARQISETEAASEMVMAPQEASPIAAPAPGAGDALSPESNAEATAQAYEQGHASGFTQGYDDGHRQGYETGIAEGRAAGRAQADRMRALADSCAASIAALEEEAGDALLSLAIRIAKHILQDELAEHPGHLRPLLRAILRESPDDAVTLALSVHPDDEALARELLAIEAQPARWTLRADRHIERGGCIVSSSLGSIDATLATRWQRVLASLGRGSGRE